MADEEVLRQARQHFIDKLVEKAPEIRSLIQRITSFDQDLNEATDFLALIMGSNAPDVTEPGRAGMTVASAGSRPKLRPDEFTGKTYFEAAKSYLDRVGHAVSMDELLEMLKNGGSPVGGKTPKKTLYISLVRSREFVPIPGQTGVVGLRKWYPGLRAGTEKKSTGKKSKK